MNDALVEQIKEFFAKLTEFFLKIKDIFGDIFPAN